MPESGGISKTRKLFPDTLLLALIFTVLSGVYTIPYHTPFYYICTYFGFPFHWLAVFSDYHRIGGSIFLWAGFVVDFLIYGVVVVLAGYIYERKLMQRYKPVELSSMFLVVCCWLFLLYRVLYTPGLWGLDFLFEVGTYNFLVIFFSVESFLRLLIGVTLSIFTWSLIKQRKHAIQ